jgi:hypothetical protein
LNRRRFPLPWSVEELDACFVVRDHSSLKVACRRIVALCSSLERVGEQFMPFAAQSKKASQ